MNLTTKQKQTHSHREQTVVAKEGGGCGGGLEWEIEVSRYKLLYIGLINNKVLLYSTKNSINIL